VVRQRCSGGGVTGELSRASPSGALGLGDMGVLARIDARNMGNLTWGKTRRGTVGYIGTFSFILIQE
jgi:hypothetical protein